MVRAKGSFGLALAIVIILVVLQIQAWRANRAPAIWTAGNILPNAEWAELSEGLPAGWRLSGDARRVDRGSGYVLDGEYALFLRGSNSFARTPAIDVLAGRRYRIGFQGLIDPGTQTGSGTARLQVWAHWIDSAGDDIRIDKQPPATLGYADDGAPTWTPVVVETEPAPEGAYQLAFSLHPIADDVLLIDNLSVNAATIAIGVWPDGAQAAISFSVDWETAMGGYIHTRAGDPYTLDEANAMGLRSRQGSENLLAILRENNVPATWFGNGYNFLDGNQAGRRWMGDPVFAWAGSGSGWQRNWAERPWFGDDPYGSVASHPGWYFGDLTRELRDAGQPIASHTFSHFYVSLASTAELAADSAAWAEVAAEHGIEGPEALAFPWGSSGGMSDEHWRLLEQSGMRAVVRTKLPARLEDSSDPVLAIDRLRGQPRLLPGYAIVALPDILLLPSNAELAKARYAATVGGGGVLDLWAHTSEIVEPDQLALWERMIDQAAQDPRVWVASVAAIGDRWLAYHRLEVRERRNSEQISVSVRNPTDTNLPGLTIDLPAGWELRGGATATIIDSDNQQRVVLDLPARTTAEIDLWLQQ